MAGIFDYNPGVTDQSGQIFAGYIGKTADAIAGRIDYFAQRAKQDKSLTQYAETSGLADKNELAGMSLEQKQGLVEGRVAKQRMLQQQQQTALTGIQLGQAQGDQNLARNIMRMMQQPQQQTPTAQDASQFLGPGQPGPTAADAMAFIPQSQRPNYGQFPTPTPDMLAGVQSLSPAGLKMLQEQKFNQIMSQGEQPTADIARSYLGPLGGLDAAYGRATSGAPDPEVAARLAGMSVADQLAIAHAGLLKAHGQRYLQQSDAPEQIDKFLLPNGQNAVALRGSKQLQILADPNAPVATEQVPDAAGNIHTIIRNPKTGAAMFVPAANTAQAQKLNVDSLVEAEKATRSIDDDISAWNSQAKRAATDKKVSAPDPNVLKDLQMRRTRLQGAINAANGNFTGTGGAPAAAGSPPAIAPPAGKTGTDQNAAIDEANKAIQRGADPAKVKARLKQLYGIDVP